MASRKAIKFLFLDPWHLEYVRGFEPRMGQPLKSDRNPVMSPEFPPENMCIHLLGTVLYDRDVGLFRAWYWTRGLTCSYLRLATSKDGYDWVRPQLDVVPGTNIVFDKVRKHHGISVIVDPDDPDESARYKLIISGGPWMGYGLGLWAYFSPDGIHWRAAQQGPVLLAPSDHHSTLYRDKDIGLYHTTLRLHGCDRRVWHTESEDMIHWRRPAVATEPDSGDPPQTHFYGMHLSPYGNYVMGLISVFNTEEWDLHFGKGQGTIDVQLAYSRDGFCWHRVAQGRKFIPLGEPGSWDSGMVQSSTTAIMLDREIRFYYAGNPGGHGDLRPSNVGGMGVASLRPDGFLALHAGEGPAELMTRSFAVREPGVYVNADATQGQVRVALCEGSSAKPFAGFTFEDCRPLCGSGSTQQVTWAGNPDPTIMVNRPIRIALRAQRADVYSVTLTNGSDPARYWEFREPVANDPMDNLVRDS